MSVSTSEFGSKALITSTLQSVRGRLNDFLTNAAPNNSEWAVLSNLFDQSGKQVPGIENRVLMFLANITHETAISSYASAKPVKEGGYVSVPPPLYVNLHILFYANMADGSYEQGLSAISATISFFQQNPSFNKQNLPSLDPRIDQLSFEFTNLDITDLNYVMGLLGAKYMPSAFYKVRLLPFVGDVITGDVPAVQGVGT